MAFRSIGILPEEKGPRVLRGPLRLFDDVTSAQIL
jgi:hypothetical protein